MSFETDEEFLKTMCAVRQDVLEMDGLYPFGGACGIPVGWLAETTIKLRCRNDHVGSVPLAALRGVQAFDAWCPHGCGAQAFVTTPIDHDGPFRSWQALQLSEPEKYGEFEKEGHDG